MSFPRWAASIPLLLASAATGCDRGPDASAYCRAFCEESFGDPSSASSVGSLPYRGSPFAERTFAYCVEVVHGAAPSEENAATFHAARVSLVGALDGIAEADPPPEPARRALLDLRALARNACGSSGS